VEGSGICPLEVVKFNLETTSDKISLISMEKGNKESVRSYAQIMAR
jgi:hypothetical protein